MPQASEDPPVLALTGATGFVGRAIARAAARDGYRVRALVRGHGRSVAGVSDTIVGDLDDAAALARLTDGVAVVVHNAGLVRARRAAEFDAVNHIAAARVAAAAVERMSSEGAYVLISSLAATRPAISPYAASKAAAEAATRRALAGRRAAILRPPAVYGPFDAATKPMFDMIRAGFAPRLGARDARFAMVHVADAATAALAAATAAAPECPVFEFDDGAAGHSWGGLKAAAEAASGRPLRTLPVPPWLIRLLGAAGSAVAQTGLATPFLTAGKAREMLAGDWLADPSRRPPGWRPEFSLQSGFTQTLACYRDRRSANR